MQPTPDTNLHYAAWTNSSVNEGVRYEAFRAWAAMELDRRLCWPRGTLAERSWQKFECVKALEEFCGAVSRRGFQFDGKHLAELVVDRIDYVSQQQRVRPIDQIYPFLRKCLQGYLSIKAEELKGRAVQIGAYIGRVDSAARSPLINRSMAEILADRELQRRENEKAGRIYRKQVKAEESRQIDLFQLPACA